MFDVSMDCHYPTYDRKGEGEGGGGGCIKDVRHWDLETLRAADREGPGH